MRFWHVCFWWSLGASSALLSLALLRRLTGRSRLGRLITLTSRPNAPQTRPSASTLPPVPIPLDTVELSGAGAERPVWLVGGGERYRL